MFRGPGSVSSVSLPRRHASTIVPPLFIPIVADLRITEAGDLRITEAGDSRELE